MVWSSTESHGETGDCGESPGLGVNKDPSSSPGSMTLDNSLNISVPPAPPKGGWRRFSLSCVNNPLPLGVELELVWERGCSPKAEASGDKKTRKRIKACLYSKIFTEHLLCATHCASSPGLCSEQSRSKPLPSSRSLHTGGDGHTVWGAGR